MGAAGGDDDIDEPRQTLSGESTSSKSHVRYNPEGASCRSMAQLGRSRRGKGTQGRGMPRRHSPVRLLRPHQLRAALRSAPRLPRTARACCSARAAVLQLRAAVLTICPARLRRLADVRIIDLIKPFHEVPRSRLLGFAEKLDIWDLRRAKAPQVNARCTRALLTRWPQVVQRAGAARGGMERGLAAAAVPAVDGEVRCEDAAAP